MILNMEEEIAYRKLKNLRVFEIRVMKDEGAFAHLYSNIENEVNIWGQDPCKLSNGIMSKDDYFKAVRWLHDHKHLINREGNGE